MLIGSPAETLPQNPDEADVEARLGRRPLRVLVRGEHHFIEDPGNFPELFEAYRLNLSGQETDQFAIKIYQEYLRSDPNGQATSRALDQLASDKQRYPMIRQAIGHPQKQVRAFYYAQMIDETVSYLPPELDAAVLRDPCAYEDTA